MWLQCVRSKNANSLHVQKFLRLRSRRWPGAGAGEMVVEMPAVTLDVNTERLVEQVSYLRSEVPCDIHALWLFEVTKLSSWLEESGLVCSTALESVPQSYYTCEKQRRYCRSAAKADISIRAPFLKRFDYWNDIPIAIKHKKVQSSKSSSCPPSHIKPPPLRVQPLTLTPSVPSNYHSHNKSAFQAHTPRAL